MKYYVESVVKYIVDQLESSTAIQRGSKRLQLMIPQLAPAVTFSLANALEVICAEKNIELELKVAQELANNWTIGEQDKLHQSGYYADGSLTLFRNDLPDGEHPTLQLLIGSAKVTDKASLADFHQCDATNIWVAGLKKNFKPWLERFFESHGVAYNDADLKTANAILCELEARFSLPQISDFLEHIQISAPESREATKELLTQLGKFDLPNLSSFVESKRPFRYYVDSANSCFHYDAFMDPGKRDKALKNLDSFVMTEPRVIEPEKFTGFESEDSFLDALTGFIKENEKSVIPQLMQCDFIYIWDEILKFRPPTEPSEKQPLKKLAGGPVEVILHALWSSLQKYKCGEVRQLNLKGISFKHDYLYDHTESYEAKEALKRMLGGVDKLLKEHIQLLPCEDGETVNIISELLNDEISYPPAKTGEPYFEFLVTINADTPAKSLKSRFAIKLPEIHSYRLADSLLTKANDALQSSSSIFPLPIFHLAYYKELMVAKDDEEICRVLLHCINECRPASQEFMENIFTTSWHERHMPLGQYLEKISSKYREFITDASQNGIHQALFQTAKPLIDSFHDATNAFITKDECASCSKLASMLMRAFLIIDQKTGNPDRWAVESFEKNGIVTILHPAIIEMLQGRILFLLTAFSTLASFELSPKGNQKFKESKWQYYVDMAAIQMPLAGLLTDSDGKLDIDVRGKELLHRIGDINSKNTPISTRLLVRYDNLDDEEISDSEIFKVTRESKLLLRVLSDYLIMHPHAKDGITLAIYRNEDVQPVLAALNNFLYDLAQRGIISEKNRQKYSVKLILFSESADDTGISNWIDQWQERWSAAEEIDKFSYYTLCDFSVSHRILTRDDGYRQFQKILDNEVDCDIIVFYNFIDSGRNGNDFMPAPAFDSTQDKLKFPILEKSFCSNLDPDEVLKRNQIVSNRQFRINAAHTEILARLKNRNTPRNVYHVILGHGDFEPWQKIIDSAHGAAEWVVCIDANIDEKLLKNHSHTDQKRELIGFGSGVGVHGESNYTISTQKFFFGDLKRILQNALKNIYKYGNSEDDALITASLMRDAGALAGLSLIRALGPSFYICDFMAYCLMHKILPIESEQHLCDQIFSIDAYRHWFDMTSDDDKTHPDLLWLRADMNEDGELELDIKLIECKMRSENSSALDEAIGQIKNGLEVLVKAFAPRLDEDKIPDQRYWYLQLHRLIACRAKTSGGDESKFLSAMEKLSAGKFNIKWSAGIFAFWIDSQKSTMDEIDCVDIDGDYYGIISVPIYAMGYKFIKNICQDQVSPMIHWGSEIELSTQIADNMPIPERETAPLGVSNPDDIDVNLGSLNFEPRSHEFEFPDSSIAQEEQEHVDIPEVAEPLLPPARIFLGRTIRGGRDVYWEFGHRQLNNRHLLIFGNSGMGKTYAIQGILCELGNQRQNSLIVDYTNGFLPNQLQEKTKEVLQPSQHIVKTEKLPINPFEKQSQEIGDGLVITDTPTDIAKRIASTFKTVYDFGPHQFSLLTDAIEEGVTRRPDAVSLDYIMDILQEFLDDGIHTKAQVMTVISKLKTFVSEHPFSNDTNLGWESLFADTIKRCHIFQLTMIDRFSANILTEFILWDLYSYVRSSGCEKYPKVVVLDEIQNLDHSLDAPVAKYLTEGRKFGISLIAATQTLSNLEKEEQSRLFQSAHKLFFRPADPEMNQYADFVKQAAGSGDRSRWISELSSLQKGECLSIGPSLNENTGQLENQVFRIKIASLEDRGF